MQAVPCESSTVPGAARTALFAALLACGAAGQHGAAGQDPAAGEPTGPQAPAAWQTLAPTSLPTARHEAAAVEVAGRLYLLGGRGDRAVEVYLPDENRWQARARPPLELHHFQAVERRGVVWVLGAFTGGYPDETPVPHAWLYDPRTDRWSRGPVIPPERRRGSAGVVVHDDDLYLVCGIVSGHQGDFVPWLDRFDPDTGTWTVLPDAPHARDHFHAAVVDGRIVAAAGRTTSARTGEVFELCVPEVDVFDIGAGTWRTLAHPIPTPRAGTMAVAADGLVLVAGGESGSQRVAHREVEVLHVAEERWRSLPSLVRGRHGGGLVRWNGDLYAISGCGNRGGAPELDSTERLALAAALRRPPAVHPARPAPADGAPATPATPRRHDARLPIVPPSQTFAEHDGVVAIEAEHFVRQTHTDVRAFYVTTAADAPAVQPDGDPACVAGASGGAYVEVLPDTRRTHQDPLVAGENFSEEPGRLAVLSYRVHFDSPGTWWLWARGYSTTSEDNGLHFGIDGTWPETARRWQTTTRDRWHWQSAQRTADVHTGVPGILTLQVDEPGEHTIEVSMREDGTALDKIVLAHSAAFVPTGLGPPSRTRTDEAPPTFPYVPLHTAPRHAEGVERGPDGDGTIRVTGELRQWHKVTVTLAGPFAHEQDLQPNPFVDRSLWVTFRHESGAPEYVVPGYFAADGDAADTGAESGHLWRAHLAPDRPGVWHYRVRFRTGPDAAFEADGPGVAFEPLDGRTGSFVVAPSDKLVPDLRARGRLAYVGRHHLQFQGDGSWFLKAGADAPETLLAYEDFDGTRALRDDVPLKTWQPHVRDWRVGDPTWRDGRGKGLIGALNYLAASGMNTFSFLPYNVDGDGSNVWPFVQPRAKLHYDCSKLDQWGIVFDHATQRGLHLHFKLQENEIDDYRRGHDGRPGDVPAALDAGALGPERMLYLRELVARFGHALALNWNLGEENTQSTTELRQMIGYLRRVDPYRHHVVLHTFPDQQQQVYEPLLGDPGLTGVSLQNRWDRVHRQTAHWVAASRAAGHRWVVANDEQGDADTGVPPDPDYGGATEAGHSIDDIRKYTLWGNLMAGGAGVEYYFGYRLAENDLLAQDWRSRDRSWRYARIALQIFRDARIPFESMTCRSELVGNPQRDNSAFCLAHGDDLFVVYLPIGRRTEVRLPSGAFTVAWHDPRTGAARAAEPLASHVLEPPDGEDWLAVLRRP